MKVKISGLVVFAFMVGYFLGNIPSLLAQEHQLPEWHIMRFLQSKNIDENPYYTKPVIVINPFTVPQGEEGKFIKEFDEVSQMFKSTPGFIDAKLHHSINPAAPYAFINIAHWESLKAFKEAVNSPQFKEMHKNFHYQGKASVYKIVKEYEKVNKISLNSCF